MSAKPSIVFVLGPPASGKGTMCTLLAASQPKIYHLSAGDYLRKLIIGPLSNRSDIVDSVHYGGTKGLVSGVLMALLLLEKMKDEMENGKSVFLLDGFPRDLEQRGEFVKMMRKEFGVETPDLTISFSCSREVAKTRYLDRNRGDDTPQLFDRRYSDYEDRDYQVVELYRDSLVEIDANAERTVDQSYAAMLERLSQSPAWTKLAAKKDGEAVDEA